MVSASIPSANEPVKDLILVHTVQLKPIIKTQISGKLVYSGISDVAIASVPVLPLSIFTNPKLTAQLS